jgi:hypothetical protein
LESYSLKLAAPISSPTAKPNVPPRRAAKVLKTSGLPLPNAKNVTPAVLSLNPRTEAIVDKFGQKKSEAVMPMNENRKMRIRRRAVRASGRREGGREE